MSLRTTASSESSRTSTRAAIIAAAAGLACATSALGQLAQNINPDLRPLVNVQFPNAPAAAARAFSFLGLFDSGSSSTYVSPQVNTLLTLASVPAGGVGNPALPGSSQSYDFSVGGFLGRRMAGPQINNGANVTHQLTSSTAGAGANTFTRSLQAELAYFNGQANLINIGQNFVMKNPARPLGVAS